MNSMSRVSMKKSAGRAGMGRKVKSRKSITSSLSSYFLRHCYYFGVMVYVFVDLLRENRVKLCISRAGFNKNWLLSKTVSIISIKTSNATNIHLYNATTACNSSLYTFANFVRKRLTRFLIHPLKRSLLCLNHSSIDTNMIASRYLTQSQVP